MIEFNFADIRAGKVAIGHLSHKDGDLYIRPFQDGVPYTEVVVLSKEKYDKLMEELVEAHVDAFVEIGMKITEGAFAGWWDSMARSTAVEHAEWLVEHAGWQRHPTAGHGRRQFYRPLHEIPG